MTIAISSPMIGEEEQSAVREVLASGMLAQGARVAEFERAFAAFIGVRHTIATNSGTSALHTALLAHGIGPGDEVITSPFTFLASVNSILYAGARPVLVDIDESFCINPKLIEAAITQRTRAIMPVHLYGQPADMETIAKIAQEHNIFIIEDACQAHGAEFAGRRVGSFGVGCFSFYATKNMTTGEGGVVTTDDDAVAARARQIINHGQRSRYYHDTLGYNYRMTDIAAAIGVEQLKKLPLFNALRVRNAQRYDQTLGSVPGLVLPRVFPNRTHVYHQYTVRIQPEFGASRDAVAAALKEGGIATGVYYPLPVHHQQSTRHLGWERLSLPVSEQMSREVLSIPVHPRVSDRDIEHIIVSLRPVGRAQ